MEAAIETAVSPGRSRRRRSGEPSPREINREQRFEQILHAAYICFTKKGFHSTSMSDIAREAGVSVGHLYNFFENRDAIVEVFAQRELDRLRKMNEFYRESNLTQEEICRRSVYEHALTKLDKTAARLTFEILSESVVNPRIRQAVKKPPFGWRRICRLWTGCISEWSVMKISTRKVSPVRLPTVSGGRSPARPLCSGRQRRTFENRRFFWEAAVFS